MTLQKPKKCLTAENEREGSGRSLQPVHSLFRHRKIVAAVGLGVLLLGLPVAWWKGRPKWRAEGALYVSPRLLRNLEGDQEHDLQSNSQYREFVQQQVRTVNRYDIIASALAPGSRTAELWQLKQESQRRAVDRLRGVLQVNPVADTYQVTVALEGRTPAGLAELVNAVMQSYVRTSHRELLFDSEARLKALTKEKLTLDESIAKLIEERTAIARQLGTTVFSGAIVNSFDRELGTSTEALMEARRQRIIAEASAGSTEPARLPSANSQAVALQNALGDNSLNGFKSALNQRKAELIVSMNGLSPQHPGRIAAEKEIQAIDRQTEAVTVSLRDRLANNLETINRARLEQSATVEHRLQKETQQIRQQIEEYSRGYQKNLELGEEIDRTRKRLHAVEDRMSYLQLETQAPGFVRVFSPALTPEIPFEGGRRPLVLLVLTAALALPLIVAVGLDYLDPHLKAPRELEFHLGLPITGWLPETNGSNASAMLRIAASIRRHSKDLRHRVLVVTALSHGGGSSTVSLGLGSALNRLGMRTLVVEANPLTPDARYIENSQGAGLISWMATPDQGQLCVAPSSSTLPDRMATGDGTAEDLLPVERLLPLFERAAGQWDLILIDAAPLEACLATEELIHTFGSALLVIDAQRDKKQLVTRALQKLELLVPDAFGSVLNKVVEPSKPLFWRKSQNDTPAVLAA